MSTMDLKGIGWVGNIYQKFEAMCLEVEEAMFQDTAKYVENQVQTVGASVKKFYSDVMQDLLPPSSTDPIKVAAADLSLNQYADVGKKPKAKLKEDIRKVDKLLTEDFKVIAGVEAEHTSSFNGRHNLNHVPPSYSLGSIKGPCSELSLGKTKDGDVYARSNLCIKGISKKDNDPPLSKRSSSNNPPSKDQRRESPVSVISENNEAARDWMAMIPPQASFEVIGCDSTEKIPNDILDATVSIDDDSVKPPPSDSILSINSSLKKGRKLRCISSSGGLSSESIETFTKSGLVSQIGSCISDDSWYSQSYGEEALMSHKGRSRDCNTGVVDNNDTTEPKTEMIEQDGKLELDETCVLVDGNELRLVSHGEGKHKSYKKKIREAFSLKMRSARKHEYEQVAAQYGDTNTGSNLKGAMTVMLAHSADSNTKKLLTHGFPESEWELL